MIEPSDELVRDVHDRMPVILPRESYEKWLDPAIDDVELLSSLLRPYPAEEMQTYPVSTLVNAPVNDVADVLADRQLAARGFFVAATDPVTGTTVKLPSPPFSFSAPAVPSGVAL